MAITMITTPPFAAHRARSFATLRMTLFLSLTIAGMSLKLKKSSSSIACYFYLPAFVLRKGVIFYFTTCILSTIDKS